MTKIKTASVMFIFIFFTATNSYAGRDELIKTKNKINSVGILNWSTSKQDIIKKWGAHNVQDYSYDTSNEGDFTHGFKALDKYKNRTIEGMWADKSKKNIEEVIIRYPAEYWRTKQGVKVGVSLKKLSLINGAPITIYTGFLDNSGFKIMSFNDGKLSYLMKSKVELWVGCLKKSNICKKIDDGDSKNLKSTSGELKEWLEQIKLIEMKIPFRYY